MLARDSRLIEQIKLKIDLSNGQGVDILCDQLQELELCCYKANMLGTFEQRK